MKFKKGILILAVAVVCLPVVAATVDGFVEFNNGDALSAGTMNKNFTEVKRAVDLNHGAIETLKSQAPVEYNTAEYGAGAVSKRVFTTTGMAAIDLCEPVLSIWTSVPDALDNTLSSRVQERQNAASEVCQTITNTFKKDARGTFTVAFKNIRGVGEAQSTTDIQYDEPLLLHAARMRVGDVVADGGTGTLNGATPYFEVRKTTLVAHLESVSAGGKTFSDCLRFHRTQKTSNLRSFSRVYYLCRGVGMVKSIQVNLSHVGNTWEIKSCTVKDAADAALCEGFPQ